MVGRMTLTPPARAYVAEVREALHQIAQAQCVCGCNHVAGR